MKTSNVATKEWGGKARKRENAALRGQDRRAALIEAIRDANADLLGATVRHREKAEQAARDARRGSFEEGRRESELER